MHFRAIRTGDVPACAALLPRSDSTTPAAQGALAGLWRALLREERISGGVVVDAAPSSRVLAFGLTAFVEERFLADYLAAPEPNLSTRLYEAVRSQRSLLLDPPAVRQANHAGALNFVILEFHLAPGLDATLANGAVAAAEAGFRIAHGGYRLRRVLQEAHGSYEIAMLASAGLQLKNDFSAYFATHRLEAAPLEGRPALMGLYADDPGSRLLGTPAASLFYYSEPRFYFSPGEQRVLGRAVLDESDEEIARELGLSIAGVKKIWRSAYERVASTESELFGPDSSERGSARGKEKRRTLVRYLRYHLYELRPTVRRARLRG
jgi:hypothetical protein